MKKISKTKAFILFAKVLIVNIEYGIWFPYKGDEVLYLWPWKRNKNNKKFVSLLCCGEFDSLKEIDRFWKEYYEVMMEDK